MDSYSTEYAASIDRLMTEMSQDTSNVQIFE